MEDYRLNLPRAGEKKLMKWIALKIFLNFSGLAVFQPTGTGRPSPLPNLPQVVEWYFVINNSFCAYNAC